MEGTVSNVEVCNFAYTGKFEDLKQCILSDKTLACKTDQVSKLAVVHHTAKPQGICLCYAK